MLTMVAPAASVANGPVSDPPVWYIGALARQTSSWRSRLASMPKPQTTLRWLRTAPFEVPVVPAV